MEFDEKYIPPAFGSINIGATCYFNSMFQTLISCTSLTKVFLANKNNAVYLANTVAVTYIRILEDIFVNKELGNIMNAAPALWHSIIDYLRTHGEQKHFGHGQEDTHESFQMLMECWEKLDEVMKLFTHVDNIHIYCTGCEQWDHDPTKASRDEELTFFSVTPSFKNELPASLEKRIKSSIPSGNLEDILREQLTYIKDYRCQNLVEGNEKCLSTADKIKHICMRYVPHILIVVCMKYAGKVNSPFPPYLTIGPKKYKAIAHIIHSGDIGGGHYYAKAIRDGGWFTLNDSGIAGCGTEFAPEEGTYVVTYHSI
jgi:ubiquitin C-terminal hydrolase